MAQRQLAARGIAARPRLAPLCRDRVAGLSLASRPGRVCRGIPVVLRRGAGKGARAGDGVALRRRDGDRQLLHLSVARQPGAGAGSANSSDRRGRGPPLQAFLPFFPQIQCDRAAAPASGGAGFVAAAAYDRRRRPARRAQARPRRASASGPVRRPSLQSGPPSVPRFDAPLLPGRNEHPHAAEAARSRSAHTATDGAGPDRARPAQRAVMRSPGSSADRISFSTFPAQAGHEEKLHSKFVIPGCPDGAGPEPMHTVLGHE